MRIVFVMVLALALAGHAFGQATLQITPATLPGGVNGTPYPSQVLQATGGTPPYGSAASSCSPAPAGSRWCVVSGSLPTGLSLSKDSGIISGTPAATPATYNFVVELTDSAATPQTANRSFSIVVTDPLVITTTTLPNGSFNSAYSQSLSASGGTLPNTWTTVAGTLPPGLALSTGGTIAGSPTSSGVFTFTVRATDSSTPAQSDTQALSITVPLAVTTTTLPNAAVGAAYGPQTLTASPGGATPYSWAVTGGALPSGLTLSGAGVIDGIPTTGGNFNFTVSVNESPGTAGPLTGSKALSIRVTDFVITTTSLPDGTFGSAYPQQTLATAGGTLPNTWSTIVGALPPGLSLNASNGTISGTPSDSGRFSFTVRAVDSSNPALSATKDLTLAVRPSITTNSLPNGAVGLAYTPQTLTAGPGVLPYTWSVPPGTLPPGLTLSAAGVLDGTPTAAGTFNFTVSITDSSTPPLTNSKPFTIIVQPALVITTTSPLPTGAVGVFYVQQFSASGPTPVTWSVASGTPPPGLSLSSSGALTGTPSNFPGTYGFAVQASAGNPTQTTQQTFVVTINPALSIVTQALPNATRSGQYSTTLVAQGGIPPYTWSATTFPPQGLSLSTTGVLSGTPTNAGTFQFTVQVTDTSAAQPVTRNFTLTVSAGLAVTTATLPDGEAGTVYPAVTLTAAGGSPSYTWALEAGSSLPAGMSLSVDGTLSGTPATANTYAFTVVATDSSNPAQTATKALTLKIHAPLDITTPSLLPTAVAGVFYFKQLDITSGQTALTWTVSSGGLPPGIALGSSTGLLSGQPLNTPGTYDFTIKVNGTNPVQTTQKAFRIIVNPALRITTPLALPDAFLGVPYSQTLAAVGGLQGGSQPYTWTNPGGGLPPGLSLSSAGVLSGSPAGIGTYSFLIQVDDSFSPTQTVTSTFTLRVNNSLRISTESLPNAIVNFAYSQQLQATGGTVPLTWVVNSGTLPTGLTLTLAGLLSGTPTIVESKTVTVTVTDLRGVSVSKDFTITVNPALPALSAPSLPSTISPATASPVAFALASPFPSPLTGKLVLTFTSKAEVAGDDPMTRFSNGTRSVSFTIPANETSAVLETAVSLTAGTVAGTVRLAANFDNGPQDVTVATTDIAATAPRLTNVVALRTGNALEVQITGYSPARRIISAEFTFDLNIGGTASRVTVPANVGTTFAAWFTSATSIQFGSAFSYVQSFDYAGGNVNDVQSVTVRLTNAQGSVVSQVISFK